MPIAVFRRGKRMVPPGWENEGAAIYLRPAPQALIEWATENRERFRPAKNADGTETIEFRASDMTTVLRTTLCGFEGLVDEDGDVTFDPQKLDLMIDLLPPHVRTWALERSLEMMDVSDSDRKNLQSGSTSRAGGGKNGVALDAASPGQQATNIADDTDAKPRQTTISSTSPARSAGSSGPNAGTAADEQKEAR